jgi:hypothetical protein
MYQVSEGKCARFAILMQIRDTNVMSLDAQVDCEKRLVSFRNFVGFLRWI